MGHAHSKKTSAFLKKIKNITALIYEGFAENQIAVGASTLTYYTLLSLVPILGFFIGYARGFLTEGTFTQWLLQTFPHNQVAVQKLIEVAERSLDQAHNGVIVGVGALIYIWAGIQLFKQLEFVMNEMWEVTRTRPFFSRFGDYIALFFLAPILAAVSISITAFFAGGVVEIDAYLAGNTFFIWVFYCLINLVPFLFSWFLMTFLFIYIPNVPVKWKPAVIAGGVTAFVFEAFQFLYIFSQSWMSAYNTVYGTLVALPLLLIWIHASWSIILLGSKIAFAIQHANSYGFHSNERRVAHTLYCALCIRFMHLMTRRFLDEKPPLSDEEISNAVSIPQGLTNMLLDDLVDANLIVEVNAPTSGERAFQPAVSVESLTVAKVLEAIRSHGTKLSFLEDPKIQEIIDVLKEFQSLAKKSPKNSLIRELK